MDMTLIQRLQLLAGLLGDPRPRATVNEAIAELERLKTAEKIAQRMALCYSNRPTEVAQACDDTIDRSGNLLGWVRDVASANKQQQPNTQLTGPAPAQQEQR